ncbi:MAG: hypothetical protein M3019_11345 [Candidatus Dormibacteraeota bacterium]|nr:hypothetical protein [Candidatus Dormibacteraeota bacterium]
MGQRTKGKMWCKRCGPVLGVKNTHRIRNAGAVLAGPVGIFFSKVEDYFCSQCGAKVRPAWMMAGADSPTGAPVDETPPAMVTPDRKWISFDGGEHYMSTATSPPPPAPPAR